MVMFGMTINFAFSQTSIETKSIETNKIVAAESEQTETQNFTLIDTNWIVYIF